MAFSARGQVFLDTICGGVDTAHFAVSATNGSTYQWTVQGGSVVSGWNTSDVGVLWENVSGSMMVSVVETDSNGCIGDTVRARIFLRPQDRAFIDGLTAVCRNEFIYLDAFGGDDFVWSNGDTTDMVSFQVTNDTTVYLVAINAPCPNDTFYHTIRVVDFPEALINQLEDTLQINSERDVFYLGTAASEVEWYVNDQYSGQGYGHSLQFRKAGDQEVIQVAKLGDCTDTAKLKVHVRDDFAVHIPNAFTPNGDGLNDSFEFFGVGMKHYTALIYTRWGEQVHSWTSKDEFQGWNGIYNGILATPDVYVYRIVVMDYHGIEHKYSGQVTLVR